MWVFFGVMVAIQLFIPAQMIYSKNQVRHKGITYKFELEAIDPNDPFRGKYIILNPKDSDFKTRNKDVAFGRKVFASFNIDSLGYASISEVSNNTPDHSNYLTVESFRRQRTDTTQTLRIKYPFDRYYMNEHKALAAEKLTRAAVRDSAQTCYAEVAIYKGQFSLMAIKINGVDIEDLAGAPVGEVQ